MHILVKMNRFFENEQNVLLDTKKKCRFILIKQFVVTNCSKERPGSIVTKTLRNWILISIATSKELHFNADFKYIISSSLVLPIKSYEPEKICLILENRGKHPIKVVEFERKWHHQIQRIREPYCRGFKLLSTKMWNFVFFGRRQITGACLFVFSFSQGSSHRPSCPRILQEGSFLRKWKVLVPFLSDQKIGGHLGPLPR